MIDWTEIVVMLVGLVFTSVIIPLVTAMFKWLKGKTENEAIQAAISEAEKVADSVVASLQSNVVDGLKAKSADGKLTADEAKDVANKAIDMFISDLSSKSMKVINDNADDISAYIQNLIESRLLQFKK